MIDGVLGASPADRAIVTLLVVPPVARNADLGILSPAELARAARFAFDRDRSTFVTARAALRRLLADACAASPAAVPIEVDAVGRPYLPGEVSRSADSPLDFNVSHSGRLVAIGVARGRRIGVDVEWHGRTRSLRDLEAQVMGERERAMLQLLDGRDHTAAFLGCWTRKEAIVKGLGVGISYPLTTIDLPEMPSSGSVTFDSGAGGMWFVTTSSPLPEYTLSVALAGVDGKMEIRAPVGEVRAP